MPFVPVDETVSKSCFDPILNEKFAILLKNEPTDLHIFLTATAIVHGFDEFTKKSKYCLNK